MAVVKNLQSNEKPSTWSDRAIDVIARLIVHHTLTVFFTLLALMLLLTIGAVANGNMSFSEDGDRTWEVASGSLSKDRDAVDLAIEQADTIGNSTVQPRTVVNDNWSLFFLYDLQMDEDILQGPFLQEICQVEQLVFNRTSYSDFCVLDLAGNCTTQANSIVTLFYGPDPNCTLLDETYVNSRANEIYNALNTLEGQIQYGTFIGKDALSRSPVFTRRTRSVYNFGSPLEGYASENDRDTEQNDLISDNFFNGLEDDLFEYFNLKDSFFSSYYRHSTIKNDVETRWYSQAMQWREFNRLLNGDISYAILSILFVLFWMRVHTGSCFIALFGMFQIVLSLPMAAFIYGTIGGVPYFQILHILIIFLVLGIGADDIFVYHDGWKQTRFLDEIRSIKDDHEYTLARVRYAYSRTARAVFNTSFSTAVAFLSQTGSEIMPIRSLGIYATLAIVLNYLLAISFTPVMVLIADRYFSGCKCGNHIISCCHVRKATPEDANATAVSRARNSQEPGVDVEGDKVATDPEEEPMPKTGKWMEMLYTRPMLYSVDVGGHQFKPFGWFLFIALLAYAIQAFYFTFQLTPPNSQEQWFPDDHMWTGFVDDLQDNYISQTDEQYATGRLAFGISGVDRGGFDFWKPDDNIGAAVFDPAFNGTSVEAQQALLDACAMLRAKTCASDACDIPFLVFPDSVRCFMEDFKDWMQTENSITLPSPIPTVQYLEYLNDFRTDNSYYQKRIGFVNDEFTFAVVDFLFTGAKGAGFDKTGTLIDLKNDLQREIAANTTGRGLGAVLVAGDNSMVFYDTQKGLISNLVQGLGISTPVVFLLLLLATQNLQISFVAVISVLSIVASVLGLCKWLGWSLGVAEAIAGVIVIGFAVDYTLHLGHMYMEGKHHGHQSREARFRFAISTMGSTVVAGAVTTFGSGVFMFLAQVTFFFKMAVLMCSTIGFSFLFSFGFFMAHCAVMGPEHNFATIPFDKCFGAVKNKCCGGR